MNAATTPGVTEDEVVREMLDAVDAINELPVKTVNGTVVFIRDVAHVSDKYMPQTNVVHAEGKKGALVSIYKLGKASTLDIVKRIKEAVPKIYPCLPRFQELKITPLFDQSVFVRGAVRHSSRRVAPSIRMIPPPARTSGIPCPPGIRPRSNRRCPTGK